MGFDAFGLPAENFAIKTGIHPQDSTVKNIENMETITRDLNCKIITYSESQDADYMAKNISFDSIGNASFDLYKYGF